MLITAKMLKYISNLLMLSKFFLRKPITDNSLSMKRLSKNVNKKFKFHSEEGNG